MPKDFNNVVPVNQEEWETISGLIDKQNGWMVGCRFGFKDEYAQAVAKALSVPGAQSSSSEGLMFLVDYADDEGIVVASQGYSVGGGWIVSEDGLSISHATRSNIIRTSIYGQLIDTVVKGLKVDMKKYGSALRADTWERLGFYVEQKEHKTVGGQIKTSPMPVKFLGEMPNELYAKYLKNLATAPSAIVGPGVAGARSAVGPGQIAAAKSSQASIPADIEMKLSALAKVLELKAFMDKALSLPGVAENDLVLSQVLDSTPQGFWAQHHGK